MYLQGGDIRPPCAVLWNPDENSCPHCLLVLALKDDILSIITKCFKSPSIKIPNESFFNSNPKFPNFSYKKFEGMKRAKMLAFPKLSVTHRPSRSLVRFPSSSSSPSGNLSPWRTNSWATSWCLDTPLNKLPFECNLFLKVRRVYHSSTE